MHWFVIWLTFTFAEVYCLALLFEHFHHVSKKFCEHFCVHRTSVEQCYGVAFDGVVGTRFSINLAWYLDLIQLGTAQRQEARKNKKNIYKEIGACQSNSLSVFLLSVQ